MSDNESPTDSKQLKKLSRSLKAFLRDHSVNRTRFKTEKHTLESILAFVDKAYALSEKARSLDDIHFAGELQSIKKKALQGACDCCVLQMIILADVLANYTAGKKRFNYGIFYNKHSDVLHRVLSSYFNLHDVLCAVASTAD
jgi:hypothetical protein